MSISHVADGDRRAAAPAALLPYRQFVVWRLIDNPKRAKPDKVPFNAVTGRPAASTDPATWCDYARARTALDSGGYEGIGFVFTTADPFIFIDLDDCCDLATGQWKPHAHAIMAAFPGAWETSQSGIGLHGVGVVSDKAMLATKRRKFECEGNKIECYTSSRFMAIGGKGWTGEPGQDWTEALASWLPDGESASDYPAVDWRDEPRADYDGPGDDGDLIRRATGGVSPLASLGRVAPFAMLWSADPALGQFFPDNDGGQGRPFDHSSADLALMNALAWWTGCNPVRMERLFNQSALARGDQRKARLAIAKAIADPNRSHFSRVQRLRDDQRIGDDVTFGVLPSIVTLEQSLAAFAFIGDGSHVASRSTKTLRKFGDAVHEMAASKHEIGTGKIDNEGKAVTKMIPVMKLWLESPQRLSADVATWAPGEPEFCRAPERLAAGDAAYNLWSPPPMLPAPDNWQDWAKPFLDHVAYLVPVEAERERFLRWLAHIFQRPGELPHTCYLMIATETGIGRGTLASILTRCLRGYVAANMSVDALFGGFNGRISQKLLATVDEVREGNSSNRYTKAEALKSKITEEARALNPKYGSQSVEKNCCRWLMFSNHMDALPFDNNDRRIIVIENPSLRAGPEWYGYLHGLMNNAAFIGSVQHFMTTLELAGYNPHEPAPLNDAKRKALGAIASDATQACLDFMKQWQGDLATVSDLREFMGEDAPTTPRAMSHEIERAGMATAKRRVRNMGIMRTVLIVRGTLTPSDIDAAPPAMIAKTIEAAQHQFRT